MRWALVLVMACGGRVTETAGGDAGYTPFAIPQPDSGSIADASGAYDDVVVPDSPILPSEAGGSWCDGFPFEPLCDDFDHAIEPKPQWSVTGNPSLAAMPFQSAPKSLRAQSGSYVSVTSAKAAISAKLPVAVFAASDGASGSDPTVVAIESEAGHGIRLELVPGTNLARCVVKGFDGGTLSHDFSFGRGAWHDVTLKISSDIIATCEVDNVFQSWTVTTSVAFGKMTHTLGVVGTTANIAEAYFDNVLPMFEQ